MLHDMFAYHTAAMTSTTQKLTTNENTITNAPVNAYTTTQKIGNHSELSTKQYCVPTVNFNFNDINYNFNDTLPSSVLMTQINQGPAKLRDSIRFRIVRPIRDSIRIDGPIRNFRIVRAVNRHS